MSNLINASAIPYHKTVFSTEVTLYPSATGISNDNRFDCQIYRHIKSNELDQCLKAVQELAGWSKNWDGYGAEKPGKTSISSARDLIRKIFELSYNLKFQWRSPHVSADSSGNVSLEWWGKNDKKITLYLDGSHIEFIKSFSPDIDEMEDGRLDDIGVNAYQELFGWLDE